MSGPVMIISYVPCLNRQVRDEAVERMTEVAKALKANEPDTYKYCICLPVEDDGTRLYVVEEFKDMASWEIHGVQPGVQGLVEWGSRENRLQAGYSVGHYYYLGQDFHFDRPDIEACENPFIVFTDLDYSPDAIATAVPYWKAVVEGGRDNEPGTLWYGVMKDLTTTNRLHTIEVYESKDYLYNVHVPSNAVQENIKNTTHLRTGLRHIMMKRVGGFLHH